MALIKDHAERQERAAEKRHALLRFLRDELYTTPPVAAEVIGVGERGARQTVLQMEKLGLVRRHVLPVLPGFPPVTLIAITSHGQAMAFDPETEEVKERTFEVGKYSLVYLAHTLDIQRLRIQTMATGRVTRWVPGESLGATIKNTKRPDALLLLNNSRVAVEVERTIKNRKRYVGIVASHLTAIKQGKWQKVVWTSPDESTRRRLEVIIKSIKHADIAGISTQLTPEHFSRLCFTTHEQFVNNL